MQFLEEEIVLITQDVWQSILEMNVERSVVNVLPPNHLGTLAGCVQITGAWEGTMVLHCSTALARLAASRMFGIGVEDVTTSEAQETLGELTNMIGGNLKALLPEPCYLSLPTVVEGTDYTLRVPGSRQVSEVTFACDNEPLVVRLLQRDGT